MIAGANTRARPHLVLIDIGNTNVALAAWADDKRNDAVHLPIDPIAPVVDALEAKWNELPASAARAVVISSVCPPVLAALQAECKARGIAPLLVVGKDLAPPIPVDLPKPDKVGTDRLCTAAAAFAKVKCACVVADFGTAGKIDLVADNNVFLGGTIFPGLAMSARALHEHTALLPLVEIGAPEETLGKDTESAIRNGVFAMMAGALKEITERYATQIGKWPTLILTGGDAPAIARVCEFVDRVIPDLCLDGLVIAYQQHADRRKA